MVAPDVDMNNTYWALKNKFKLEVGVENNIDSRYPELCWFKQGIYCFTSLSMSNQTSNFTITLSGKDKTCLLNGDLGGTITASTDFGQLEEQTLMEDGTYLYDLTDIPIIKIIKNLVHTYANEPMSNIIINDVDEYGLELLEYRADVPMYMFHSAVPDEDNGYLADYDKIGNITFNKKKEYKVVWLNGNNPKSSEYGKGSEIYLADLADKYEYPGYVELTGTSTNYAIAIQPVDGTEVYFVSKYEYGDTAGYRPTDLTYPGELTANIGETVASILDKIKNMFTAFEYFYDVDGRFVFQQKKNYVNESWTPKVETEDGNYVQDAMYSSSAVYFFENEKIVTAVSNQPNLLNFKNDYSIWGKRTSVSGTDLPVHLRQAIMEKPTHYVSERRYYNNIENEDEYTIEKKYFVTQDYSTTMDKNNEIPVYIVDWREIIYQMAADYYNMDEWLDNNSYNNKPSGEITFRQLVQLNNPDICTEGRTGYEMFYTDMQGFWRQLYFPGLKYNELITKSEKRTAARTILITEDNKTSSEITKTVLNIFIKQQFELEDQSKNRILNYYLTDFYDAKNKEHPCYAKNIYESPETLNFWFDFIDANGDYSKYAIPLIGDRAKAINDDSVKTIYNRETPAVLFVTGEEMFKSYQDFEAYTYINLTSQMENYFTISSQGKSAWDELQTQMYQYTNFAESITLTAVPIYYLEPNNRILVKNDAADINGEYIVTKITVPLAYNGTTSITATKAVERIY